MARTQATRSAKVIEISSNRLRHDAPTRDEAKAYAHAYAKDMSAEWVFNVRTKKGLTQAALGSLIGVTGARISQLENPAHRAPVSLEILCEIARALDVPLMFKHSSKHDPHQPNFRELSVR